MKSTLLALIIATGVATMAQAVAVNWSATASSNVEGLTAYLVLDENLPSTITSVSDITGKASANAAITKNGRNYNTGEKKLSLNPDDYSSGDDVKYTIFIVSGDQYYSVGSKTATAYNDLASPPESANSNGGVSNTSVPAPGGTGWTTPGPVPEPTTVALLALGLAALGLKRKVA